MNIKHQLVTTIITVVAATSVTAIGAYAFFNVRKSINTNRFTAGTLDLDVTANGNVNEPINIGDFGSSGKVSGSKVWKIRNSGSLPGKLIFNLQNINNQENGCNAPEIEAEPGCEKDSVGELGKAVAIEALVNGEKVAETTLDNGKDFVYDKSLTLQPKDEVELTVNWKESSQGFGNEAQSDSVGFDMVFRLEQ